MLRAVREARENIRLLAELRGELDRSTTLNLYVNPEWRALKALLVEALGTYPDARAAVVRAIQAREERRELEAGNGQHG